MPVSPRLEAGGYGDEDLVPPQSLWWLSTRAGMRCALSMRAAPVGFTLALRNAYFNICRLGAVIRHFIPNCYGRNTSPLHGDLPTDRALAEWHLNSTRVPSAVRNDAPPDSSLDPIKISIPANIGELKRANPSQAWQLQAELRRRLQDPFARGYTITRFERGNDICHYLFERYED